MYLHWFFVCCHTVDVYSNDGLHKTLTLLLKVLGYVPHFHYKQNLNEVLLTFWEKIVSHAAQ